MRTHPHRSVLPHLLVAATALLLSAPALAQWDEGAWQDYPDDYPFGAAGSEDHPDGYDGWPADHPDNPNPGVAGDGGDAWPHAPGNGGNGGCGGGAGGNGGTVVGDAGDGGDAIRTGCSGGQPGIAPGYGSDGEWGEDGNTGLDVGEDPNHDHGTGGMLD